MWVKADITEKRFGRLIAKQIVGKKGRRYLWDCACDCGNHKIATVSDLRFGVVGSCGCLQRDSRTYSLNKHIKPEAAARGLFWNYRKRVALRRGHKFELDFPSFVRLTSSPCHYCGEPPSQTIKSCSGLHTYRYNGIDRMDNKGGYVCSNVVPCCKTCNFAKRDMGYMEFKRWILRLSMHQAKGGTCCITLGEPPPFYDRIIKELKPRCVRLGI